jgi:hypothetical protein
MKIIRERNYIFMNIMKIDKKSLDKNFWKIKLWFYIKYIRQYFSTERLFICYYIKKNTKLSEHFYNLTTNSIIFQLHSK